jgi:hypothetical protein
MARSEVIECLLMSAGFLMLACEARFEHRAALVDDWRPWIAVVAGITGGLAVPTLMLWRGARANRWIFSLYAICIAAGLCGSWFHAGQHAISRAFEVMRVCFSPLAIGASVAGDHPPLLAPGAFVGLGAIGILLRTRS